MGGLHADAEEEFESCGVFFGVLECSDAFEVFEDESWSEVEFSVGVAFHFLEFFCVFVACGEEDGVVDGVLVEVGVNGSVLLSCFVHVGAGEGRVEGELGVVEV